MRRRPIGAAALALVLGLAAFAPAPARAQTAERAALNTGLPAVPGALDRTSPAATWRAFLELAEAGRYTTAAHLLDLTEVPQDEQREVGSGVAAQLYRLLRKVDQADPTRVGASAPGGDAAAQGEAGVVVAARFEVDGEPAEIWLRRTLDGATGEEVWLFTRRTVSSVPLWYAQLVEGRTEDAVALNEGLGPAPDTVDRSNPRAAVVGYLEAARAGDFARAAHYLDLGALPDRRQADEGPRLARRLKIVLDRVFWVVPGQLSNDPAGVPEAGLPVDRERLTTVEMDGREVDLLLSRVVTPEGEAAWVFGPSTVAAIAPLYEVYGFGWLGDHLPDVFFAWQLWEVLLWQWIALLLLVAVGWLIARALSPMVLRVFQRAASRTTSTWDDALVEALEGPLTLALVLGILVFGLPWLRLSAPVAEVGADILKLLTIVVLAWLASRWLSIGAGILQGTAVATQNQVARSFIPIFTRITSFLVWGLALVVALDQVGVQVVGLVAGLGIGGIAIAFAAQKTIENLFGSIAIAADRPFQVGDFVRVGDVVGTVEDVGLRSTRIRTLARTVVTIPNGMLVTERVENFAVRDRFLLNTTIGVLYSSSQAQIEYIIDELKKHLWSRDDVFKEVVRVRLQSFGSSSIDIGIFTWILAADFNDYLAKMEDINFQIFRIVEASGTGFAFPSQTLYLGRDSGIDADKAAAAAAAVENRRTAGELWVPEKPPEPEDGAQDITGTT